MASKGRALPLEEGRVPGEEDGNSFQGHSLQFKDSLGKTSLWSVLALEAARLHGGSSNAVFWRKNSSAPFRVSLPSDPYLTKAKPVFLRENTGCGRDLAVLF